MNAKSGAAKLRAKAVRVRKAWGTPGTADSDVWVSYRKLERDDSPCFVICNPPPGLSCAKIKRLVEIAGNPEPLAIAIFEQTHPRMPWLNNPQCHDQYIRMAADVLRALGLSSPAASRLSPAKGIK